MCGSNNDVLFVCCYLGVPLQPGTLWINEQVPGFTRSEDVTGVILRNGGYWPSYNVPYNGFIYNISGFWTAYQKFGDQYSYLNCPRAKIFARDYPKVGPPHDMDR